MKIIKAQNAVLTNFEVYDHIVEMRARYNKGGKKRRGPPNMETVVREVVSHLQTPPGPLSQQPVTYTVDSIDKLLQRFTPYDITKAEALMIFNLRPTNLTHLHTIIEDMGERFTEEEQLEMVAIIAEVLGQFPDTSNQTNVNGSGST